MSAAHDAVDVVRFLLSTGAATDLARTMGEAFAEGFAATAKTTKESGAASALADALEDAVNRCAILHGAITLNHKHVCGTCEVWQAALRAAGRFP